MLIYLKCRTWWLDIYVRGKMISTIKWINTPNTSHTFFFFWGECLRFILAKFQLYNEILTTVTMPYIRSLKPFLFITESLYAFTLPRFPGPSALGNYHSTLFFCKFEFFFSFLKIPHINDTMRYLCSIWLIALSIMSCSFICVVTNDRISFCKKSE